MSHRREATACAILLVAAWACAAPPRRATLWIDLYQAEPVSYAQMIKDLAGVRVVYVGESHRVARHHETELQILRDLAASGRKLAVGLEQFDVGEQPALDRYNRGELDFNGLLAATRWATRWGNYLQYKPLLEAARAAGAPLVALNAPDELVHQVVRSGGVAKLTPELRKQLPAELMLHEPPYEKLLGWILPVHKAATPERLRPMIEAQIVRDEMMASALARYLASAAGEGRLALVVCGNGHVEYGLGIVSRVRRRIPGLEDRIVLLSDSGDTQLTAGEKAALREIEITHAQRRQLGLPAGDYLQATSRKWSAVSKRQGRDGRDHRTR